VARHNYIHRNSLTFAQLLARLQAMREAFRRSRPSGPALSTRANLPIELLRLTAPLDGLDEQALKAAQQYSGRKSWWTPSACATLSRLQRQNQSITGPVDRIVAKHRL
jgi:hypothetical protein